MFSGTKSQTVSEREKRNRAVSRKAAAEGMVLMKNQDHLLPLEKGCRIALYGSGARKTVKGGIGSGDVNDRETVSIEKGLLDKGFRITTGRWLDEYDRKYKTAKEAWRDGLLAGADTEDLDGFFYSYVAHPFCIPDSQGIPDVESDAETAVYVISRRAGEAADRSAESGDYYLTEGESRDLRDICRIYEDVVLIINTGGIIDLSFTEDFPQIKSILYMSQAGMEGGNALADIISGDVQPSGKLTDTWAVNYEDYPCARTYGFTDGSADQVRYHEGIYVGYRYFDTFQVKPAYAFGYGLTYAEMEIIPDCSPVRILENGDISVRAAVKNADAVYCGREVVQVYVSCPQDREEHERRRLCGFAKTRLLKPGEKTEVEITFPYNALASYYEKEAGWIIEKGLYGVWIGNASDCLRLCGGIRVETDIVTETARNICPLQENLNELRQEEPVQRREEDVLPEEKIVVLHAVRQAETPAEEDECMQRVEDIAGRLTEDELIHMVTGEVSRAQGSRQGVVGSAGNLVPGSAGETSSVLMDRYGIPGVVMADGPAGIRIKKSYQVSRADQQVIPDNPFAAFEGGFFAETKEHADADIYYQFCTSFPVGTLLAQTWDTGLVRLVGEAVGVEMREFGIGWWLAPGMNIHRDPLCGRNFEYYSEDPLLSGMIAAAVVQGVQSVPGTGATIKHFACNNQEENRLGSDSILSERALREIYLKGFEIAAKMSRPVAVMTSFNLVNGVHTANSYDLCTQVLRNEWDIRGIVMTDWSTTNEAGGSIAWKCISAGNDLIMPGTEDDIDNIREALAAGKVTRDELRTCAERILKSVAETVGSKILQ
ncbi:MAG TPA: glycoside hydrolase family 3 C-terminal domain-containing protein [Candidatus Mediterraneibacter excrementavium]|nr:glycoside hydrolase family 3 C-terminal domain-containing protein [Candidatus Mediterraneibacter excrementavium]